MATPVQQIMSDTNNYLFWGSHATEIADTLVTLQQSGSMVDVTLQAGNEVIKVHRMVLCASSPFLQQLLASVDDPTPNIILPEIEMKDLKSIIDFIYKGEINFILQQLPSLVKVAELLGIQGLNEMSSEIPKLQIQQDESIEEVILPVDIVDNEPSETISLTWESDMCTEDEDIPTGASIVKQTNIESGKRKKKISSEGSNKEKKYSEEMLEEALKEMKAGRPLCDTASAFSIPRTTLYMRARMSGVLIPSQKLNYTSQQLQEAIDTVKAGASLQHAADRFGIPKTVLWRRVQAIRGEYNIRSHQNYTSADKQAAIEALERGEQLHVVSEQYSVPKTTLFREKVKLVEKGILPSCSIKRRSADAEFVRNLRVEQAVAACKEGKMSQAAASVHFQVPKTTIWRHMQGISQKSKRRARNNEQGKQSVVLQVEESSPSLSVHQTLEEQETYSVDSGNIKFVIEDGEFATSSLIILSSVEGEHLQAESHLIESSETDGMQEEEEEEDEVMDESDDKNNIKFKSV